MPSAGGPLDTNDRGIVRFDHVRTGRVGAFVGVPSQTFLSGHFPTAPPGPGPFRPPNRSGVARQVAGTPGGAGPHCSISGARPGGSSAPTRNERPRATGALDATAALCSQLTRPPTPLAPPNKATTARPARDPRREASRERPRTRRARPPAAARPANAARQAFNVVAPTSTGPATPNDNRDASAREYPSARAAARVAPLRDTPGTNAAAWASPSHQPGSPAARSGARSAAANAAAPATRPTTGSSSSIARSKSNATTTAGAKDRASVPRVRRQAEELGRQRHRRTRVQRDLELLAPPRVPRRDVPPEQPRQRGHVRGRGDRQQFGRALDQAQGCDLEELRRTSHPGRTHPPGGAGTARTATPRRAGSPRRRRSRCSAGAPSSPPSSRPPACR